jgi:single-strand DNA-binding protein
MFDTYVTIVGNVLTKPEFRRMEKSGAILSTFRVASTARRYDKENNRWTDGNSLRLRVSCWRNLADGVGSSVIVGDPVIVVGRLYTRDWLTEEKELRVAYEMDAVAVGHDLSRGTGKFQRRKKIGTVAVEDDEAEVRIGGELSEIVPELNAATLQARGRDEADFEEYGEEVETFAAERLGDDALTFLREGGLDPQLLGTDQDDTGETGEVGETAESGETGGDGDDDGASDAAARGGGRGRRQRGRQPVPA